jgi:nicotinamidase-related amidase
LYFLYNSEHADKIDSIVVTLDTHHREHIAHANFWSNREDGQGDEPPSFTQILSEEIGTKWFPKDPSLLPYCVDYTQVLEAKGRFTHTIWPEHCLAGSAGHSVVPVLRHAIDEFLWRDSAQSVANTNTNTPPNKSLLTVVKGTNNLTEMYSAVEAEVPLPSEPATQTNYSLLLHLKKYKQVSAFFFVFEYSFFFSSISFNNLILLISY